MLVFRALALELLDPNHYQIPTESSSYWRTSYFLVDPDRFPSPLFRLTHFSQWCGVPTDEPYFQYCVGADIV